MEIKGKRILVTGAGGFIGSNLVESLLGRASGVRALVHYNSAGGWGHLEQLTPHIIDEIEIIQGNVEDPFSVSEAVKGCEVVFHLAALIAIPYSYQSPHSYVSTNVAGTLNVLEACRTHGVRRLVHTSTSETYGTALYSPIDEGHPLQGQSPYSATKIAADKLAESYFRSFDLPVTTLRPFNTYGPRQSARAVIPTVISQALWQNVIKLGSLLPVRDLTYVQDTVAAFIAVAEADDAVGTVTNCGSGRGIAVGALADRILQLMGIKGQRPIVPDGSRLRPTKSEVFELLCDNRRAMTVAGWEPTVTLDEGLLRTIEYIRCNPQRYKSHLYTV